MATATYKKLLLLAALPALVLAACSRDEMTGETGNDRPDAQNGEIRFEIGFAPQNGARQTDAQTRVATSADTEFTSAWEDGDEIGVFAAPHGTELAATGNVIHNVKLTYTKGKWTPDAALYWPAGGTKLDFYAYHPYDAALTDPTKPHDFLVHTDQSASTGGKSHFSLSDVMHARADNNGGGYGRGETVALAFTHFVAMVQVKVSSSMLGNYPPDALKVSLQGCRADRLSLEVAYGARLVPETGPVTITMYPCPNDGGAPGIYAYRALVPALEIARGTALFRFEYGGNVLLRSQPLANPLYLLEGRAETFDMTFPSSLATVSATKRLADLFSEADRAAVTSLRVFGEMTPEDFNFIRDQMPRLTSLDLGQATVAGNAIPERALYDKPSLKEFVFPSGITAIGLQAFFNCFGLTGSLTIPDGVETIGDRAFKGCDGFNGSLTLPANLKTIGRNAFDRCTGFTGSLNLPANLESIGGDAFNGCLGFTGPLNLPANLKTISDGTFNGCTGLTGSLTIPAGVEKIGNYAFKGCTGFKGSLNLPANLKTISGSAFSGCTGLTGPLTIPDGVETIGSDAFNGCRGFTGSLTLPANLTTIGTAAFYGCRGFTGSLTIPAGVETIGDYAFWECSGFNGSLTLPANLTTIGGYAFGLCTGFTSITCHIQDPPAGDYHVEVFSDVPKGIPLHVPAGSVTSYQANLPWSEFTNIQAIPQP